MVLGLPATIYTKCNASRLYLNSFSRKGQGRLGLRPQALTLPPKIDARCIPEAPETQALACRCQGFP